MRNKDRFYYFINRLTHQKKLNRTIQQKSFLMAATLAVIFPLVFGLMTAWAGPPFFTDDPEPVEHKHGEFYVAAQYINSRDGKAATLPHFEFNYGGLPDVHLHLIAPLQYVKPEGESSQYGYGDNELGIKFRFIQETDSMPMVGTFPIVLVPTGDKDKGLGSGETQIYLPLWLQKSWGALDHLRGRRILDQSRRGQ